MVHNDLTLRSTQAYIDKGGGGEPREQLEVKKIHERIADFQIITGNGGNEQGD